MGTSFDPSYNAQVYMEQGASALHVGASGGIYMTTGAGLHGLWQEKQLDLGAVMVASASGNAFINASGKNPSYARINGTTDPAVRIEWATAAGTTTPIFFPPIMLPDNLSTADPLVISLYGEGASANATNGFAVTAFFGIGGANVGTTMKFTSAPSKVSVSIASGSIGAGVLNIGLAPQAHASGVIDLYGAKIGYRTSS